MFKIKKGKNMNIKELIEKSGLFDKVYYLKNNQDVRLADQTPIEHYCRIGIKEDRKPYAAFDPVWYKEYYQDVKNDGVYPLLHFIKFGKKENRFQNEVEKNEYEKLQNDGFDVEFYKNSYEDLAKITDETFDFILHYIRHGKHEGREIRFVDKISIELSKNDNFEYESLIISFYNNYDFYFKDYNVIKVNCLENKYSISTKDNIF